VLPGEVYEGGRKGGREGGREGELLRNQKVVLCAAVKRKRRLKFIIN
jgi:hypothetical protein